ncbi:MAG: hypothetical protein VXY91_02030 [Bacteroidota bacterium]|nr:hypothetical protein [Bacteroidota bacterium]
MKKRTQIKAELAELAENIGSKSNTEAASAVLELYKEFALLAAEELIQEQMNDIQEDLKAQLQARIAALQSQTEVVPKESALKNASDEEDNQLSLVDVAEEIEKEKAAKAAESDTDKLVLKEDIGIDDVEIDEEEVPSQEVAQQERMVDEAIKGENKSLNERLAGDTLKFGLNDRIGFVKDLFDGSAEDFNRVVSQLNSLGSLSEAQEFLNTHVVPEYDWAANEETAERFMAAVEQRFG